MAKSPPFVFPSTPPGTVELPAFQQYMDQLVSQTISPKNLYLTQANAINARQNSAANQMAGSVARQRLGPSFQSDFAQEHSMNTAGLLGQAASGAKTGAATHNSNIYGQALSNLLGYGNLGVAQRGQTIQHQLGLMDWLASVFGSSQG